MPALLMVREAAHRLGVSYPTIKQWIYKGTIRTVRTAGGHHRVPVNEVERMLAGRARPGVSRTPRTSKRPPRSRTRHDQDRDVIVAMSGRNQLRGIVEEVRVAGLLAQVTLRVGDQRLTAVITRDAAEELKLTSGMTAVAIVKATEVMIGRTGRAPRYS